MVFPQKQNLKNGYFISSLIHRSYILLYTPGFHQKYWFSTHIWKSLSQNNSYYSASKGFSVEFKIIMNVSKIWSKINTIFRKFLIFSYKYSVNHQDDFKNRKKFYIAELEPYSSPNIMPQNHNCSWTYSKHLSFSHYKKS